MTLSQNEDPMVIFFHDPPYSCGSHGDTTAVQDEWVPVFDEDVVLVLNGHEHNYQRFQESGITYVVTGGGGAALTPLASCGSEHPTRLAGEAVHHFVSLQTGDELTVTAIDVDGDVIDRFSLPLR